MELPCLILWARVPPKKIILQENLSLLDHQSMAGGGRARWAGAAPGSRARLLSIPALTPITMGLQGSYESLGHAIFSAAK